MSQRRFGRVIYALFVAAALFVIGRNVYRRRMSSLAFDAVDAGNPTAVRLLLERGANVNAARKATPLLMQAMQHLHPPYKVIDNSRVPEMRQGRQRERRPFPPLDWTQNIPPDAEAVVCLLIARGADLRMPIINVRDGQESVTGYEPDGYVSEACGRGSVPALRCLLEKGVVPTPKCLDAALKFTDVGHLDTPNNNSPEAAAITSANARMLAKHSEISRKMVRLLRSHGVLPTPAQCVTLNDPAALKASLETGNSPNPPTPLDTAPLTLAVAKDSSGMVQLLLAYGADINARNVNNQSALHAAIANGNLKMIAILLAHGANVNLENRDTPLRAAVGSKRLNVVLFLLAHGADPNRNNGWYPDYEESTLSAAIAGLPEAVPYLLRKGADINGYRGDALRAALRSHRVDLVQELRRRRASVNPPPPGNNGSVFVGFAVTSPHNRLIYPASPLLNAVCFAPECVEMLRRAGAVIGPDKKNILAIAAQNGRDDLFAPFLALGADINGEDFEGETALTRAIANLPAAVPFLLQKGADPDCVTHSQRTPLDISAINGNIEIARLLVAHKANVNLRPPRGHTALYWAQKHKHPEIIALLEQAGAKPE